MAVTQGGVVGGRQAGWAERLGEPVRVGGLVNFNDEVQGHWRTYETGLRPKLQRDVFPISYTLYTPDSNSNLEFKFEPHSNKIQIKSNKLQSFHTSIL
jgi:hypothetical protein